ncbi:MAG TPA: DUF3142 domain-containing protein [Gammaproteobacteria bacterium]|nr:DUF3142 domain-containing protein [Gammaproteobacteria bacterium]
MINTLKIAIIILLFTGCSDSDNNHMSYWLWKLSDLKYVPAKAHLLIYQGDYRLPGPHSVFVPRGPSPGNLFKRHNVSILIRVYSLSDPDILAHSIQAIVEEWNFYGIPVTEIQIDYDSPSFKLTQYAEFLKQLRRATVFDNTGLSITGLVTWLSDNFNGTKKLAVHVDYIAYQLYNKYHPLADIELYYPSIYAIDYPYKTGITTSERFNNRELPINGFYKGSITFLNR